VKSAGSEEIFKLRWHHN